jgi:Protein of unknown function (DUF1552)
MVPLNNKPLARRQFLKGMTLGHVPVWLGIPPLTAMFNSVGTAYAATPSGAHAPIGKRFVLWFNGNGIPERFWIPSTTGRDYELTPCLSPLARVRDDVMVLSGLDNSAVGPRGNGHPTAMSALMSCQSYTGRGAGGESFDQTISRKIGSDSRFRSLQIGVSQESFGGSIQRNMSWASADRPLPPEELPHRLFDRLFGAKDEGWVNRKRSILDAVRSDAKVLGHGLPAEDKQRLEEHLQSVRDLERAVASMPPEYRAPMPFQPDEDLDFKDWPRIAKIQSDLLAYALATGQTRVASYMLTKCQGLARFPWLGHTSARHHDYTHKDGKAPGENGVEGQQILRDICRWHVDEFAYLVKKLKSIPEGDGTLLDNTLVIFVHEHAEAGPHKSNGMISLVAGSKAQVDLGNHHHVEGTIGDLYQTLANAVLGAGLEKYPTAQRTLSEIVV